MLQAVETGASQVGEMGVTPLVERTATPPVEKKVMIQVEETEETPQAAERGVIPPVVGTDAMPQVVGMWAIPQVVGRGATPQVGAAVASPRLGGPPTGAQVGPLLSLVVWLHIAGAPVPWVAWRSRAHPLAALGMQRTELRARQWGYRQALGVRTCYRQGDAAQPQNR